MNWKRLITGLWLIHTLVAFSQGVTIEAKAPSVVRSGEQFQLRYTITGDFRDFKAPSMKPFRVLSGPNQSRSSNFEFRNGKTTTSVTTTYSYWLQASETGNYTLKPATVKVSRKEEKLSNKLVIQVVSGKASGAASSGATQPVSQGQSVARRKGGSTNNGGVQAEDVFIRTETNKKTVYIGEQLVVSEKLYSRLPLSGFGEFSFPNYSGFWAQEVDIPDRISLNRVSLNNQVYSMGEMKRTILFPQKSGAIDLQQAEVEVVVQVRDNSRRQRTGNPFVDDPFFNPRVRTLSVPCKAQKTTIRVLPLPQEGRPVAFGGAVGQLSISSTIDKTTLKANEAITLKYKISGTGNLPLLELNNLKFPPDFEVYDPKVAKNIRTTNNAVTGTITYEYVLIPRSAGNYVIPAVPFVYFDPQKKKYVSLHSSSYEISVEKGDSLGDNIGYQGFAKEDVRLLGEDIRLVKMHPGRFHEVGVLFFGSSRWFLLMALILLMAMGIYLFLTQYRKRKSDVAGMKNKKANKLAKKRLRKAEQLLRENKVELFYEEVSNALWGYLADKLNIATSDLNSENVRGMLEQYDVPEETMEKFFTTVSHCDYARFAPGDLSTGMQSVFDESILLITLFEKNFKYA
ncbi:MAG: hypothetical protein CSA04_05135 [Bacteroidetes bacterium]|nr:MAG: hypothetical protein CSA04_05135 [Bacteroidota bacterium]